jgi:hypothetical protein
MSEERKQALKFDDAKPPMDLLPSDALLEISKVLAFGAKKYAPHNWRSGFAWSRLLAAALRHIHSFIDGQDNDPETGCSHLAHAACCLLFMITHVKQGLGNDDRWANDARFKKTSDAKKD